MTTTDCADSQGGGEGEGGGGEGRAGEERGLTTSLVTLPIVIYSVFLIISLLF